MKTKTIKSAIPIYIAAAVWALYGLVGKLYETGHILLCAGLSVVAYLAASKFFPGRKEEIMPTSGDSQVDALLQQSREDLEKIKQANLGIPAPVITAQIDRLEKSGAQILNAVADKKERADQVRKFMNYYLPTTTKLLEQYRTLSALGSSGEQIQKAMSSVESSLGMIGDAFDKQLDNLYKDEALDMTSDVQVLETMMAGDGLTEEGIQKAIKEDTQQCQTN
ncbi:5-bromo-4-chloroindolyl phosphate hydrolysis family protein [Eubacteriales bacterium OttesenSCG-928-N13]|nr:5-bromo-4-chloroindolyl phosphate hydrolysis family protein [Eubacteriales bacterium OttesenSCG-928-N13]